MVLHNLFLEIYSLSYYFECNARRASEYHLISDALCFIQKIYNFIRKALLTISARNAFPKSLVSTRSIQILLKNICTHF